VIKEIKTIFQGNLLNSLPIEIFIKEWAGKLGKIGSVSLFGYTMGLSQMEVDMAICIETRNYLYMGGNYGGAG